jgi:hypothetical protein
MDLSRVSQYQWFSVSKKLVLLCFITSVLLSCTNKQTSPRTQTVSNTNSQEDVNSKIHQDMTAQQYFNNIKSFPTTEVLPKLVKASELFLQEKNYLKALWLANQSYPLVSNESHLI